MWKHRFERNHISFMHLSLKRGCMTVKATDKLACSAQLGAQITLQALCCSRKCLLRADCLYFPITEEAYSISRWTTARDFGTGTLPQCALWGHLVWIWDLCSWSWLCVPERKYSLSHRQVKQTSISNLSFTTTQEHLLISSSEILYCPLSLSCTRERWLCRLFCIFSMEALVLKVFCELVMEQYQHLTAHPCTGLGTLCKLSILLEKPQRKSFKKHVIFRHEIPLPWLL